MAGIINFTSITTTDPAQLEAGVVNPAEEDLNQINYLKDFDHIPTEREMEVRAERLADLAQDMKERDPSLGSQVMISGAPYFMRPLADALAQRHLEPIAAFSIRESVETKMPDGSVQKKARFRHKGFVRIEADAEPIRRFHLSVRRDDRVALNLTQHNATKDQMNPTETGEIRVVEAEEMAARSPEAAKVLQEIGGTLGIRRLITFTDLPSMQEMQDRAERLAAFAEKIGACHAMIGGAPYFQPVLEKALEKHKVEPVYAFSKREQTIVQNQDGTETITNTFRHLGMVGDQNGFLESNVNKIAKPYYRDYLFTHDQVEEIMKGRAEGIELKLLSVSVSELHATRKNLETHGMDHLTRASVLNGLETDDTIFAENIMGFREDREVMLAAVRDNGLFLSYASDALRNDREIVLAAVRQDGMALSYASPALQNNRDVVMTAVRQNGGALQYASETLRSDREIVAEVNEKYAYMALHPLHDPIVEHIPVQEDDEIPYLSYSEDESRGSHDARPSLADQMADARARCVDPTARQPEHSEERPDRGER